MPLGRKGFYVSGPMLGVTIFLIAALIAVMIESENTSRIEVARSGEVQGKLYFISAAILADSFDVLLQENLERLTTEFLEEDYFDINTEEDWRQSLRSNLIGHYVLGLGETLGLDMDAYAKAYGDMPATRSCDVIREGEPQATANIYDSDQNDGTIMVRGTSFGETVKCETQDPKGEVKVDILGRYYRINVRVPDLYNLAKLVIAEAKGSMNAGENEPIVNVEDKIKWHVVKKADNLLVDEQDAILDNVITEWENLMGWFSDRIRSIINTRLRDEGKLGVSLGELEVSQMWEEPYELDNFELSCVADETGQFRNCMPFRISAILGDTECAYGIAPIDGDNPYFSLAELDVSCDNGECPSEMENVLTDMIRPVGSICVDYYSSADAVLPVCKKWEAKAKSVLYKGVLSDDNDMYVLTGTEESALRFKDQHPDIVVKEISESRLTCDDPGADQERYKKNLWEVVGRMQVKLGIGQDPGTTVIRWVDKGSKVNALGDNNLQEVYKSVYGEDLLPLPCFVSGPRANVKCGASEDKPKIELQMDWNEVKNNCFTRIDDLCKGLCGQGILSESYRDSFCDSIFTERPTGGGKGRLVCKCGERDVQIESMTFAR